MKLFGYEFVIRKSKRRYKTGISRKPWTTSETNALLRFRGEGKSWEEIGKLLNRTAAACYMRNAKIHKKD